MTSGGIPVESAEWELDFKCNAPLQVIRVVSMPISVDISEKQYIDVYDK